MGAARVEDEWRMWSIARFKGRARVWVKGERGDTEGV